MRREAGPPEGGQDKKHKSELGVVWRRSAGLRRRRLGYVGKELGLLSDGSWRGRGKSWERRCGLHSKNVPGVRAGTWGAGCLAGVIGRLSNRWWAEA